LGVGILTELRTYPFETYRNNATYPDAWYINGGFSDLEFPVTLEYAFQPSEKFVFGIIAGTYIEPDYPLSGSYLGFSFGLNLK
jgi:hypothetical protein